MRRAHGISKEGAPCVKRRAAKCGMRAATSPTLKHLSNQSQMGRRVRHLSRVWAATSRVRHLSKRGAPPNTHVPKSSRIQTQSISNQHDLVPLDYLFDFVPLFCLQSCPHCYPPNLHYGEFPLSHQRLNIIVQNSEFRNSVGLKDHLVTLHFHKKL
jgi:hypothetical protein